MKQCILPSKRAALYLACLLLLVSGLFAPPSQGVQASPAREGEDGFRLNFLPSQMRQLCKGDTATFTIWSNYYEEPVDPNQLPLAPLVPPGEVEPLAPLTPSYVKISAVNGQVSPDTFEMNGPSQYMRFTYTAAGEGQDTITAVIEGGTARAEKKIAVLPACEYDISFLVLQTETIDTGGFYVAFQGNGDFFVDRTAESVGELKGDGQDDLAWLMWAFVPQAVACTMDKITASSSFKVEGMLNAEPYNFLHVNLRFTEPLQMPTQMSWKCQAVGLGEVSFNVPIGDTTADPSTMDQVGLTFPLQGGIEEIQVPKGFGYVVVTRR